MRVFNISRHHLGSLIIALVLLASPLCRIMAAEPAFRSLSSMQQDNAGKLNPVESISTNAVEQKDVQKTLSLSLDQLREKKTEFQRKKYLWLGGAILSGAAGLYAKYSANQHYKEYQTATDDATKLHRLVNLEDTISIFAYAFSAVCLLPAISYQIQEIQVSGRIHVARTSEAQPQVNLEIGLLW